MTIVTPINFALISAGGDSVADRDLKRLSIHDHWFGEAARDGETTFSGAIARMNSLLSGTAIPQIPCPVTPWAVAGPIWNILNDPTQFVIDTSFASDEDGTFPGNPAARSPDGRRVSVAAIIVRMARG